MKLSSILSTAALAAACLVVHPSQAEANGLHVMGKTIENSRQLTRRTGSPRRLGGSPGRRGHHHDVASHFTERDGKKHGHKAKKHCKAKASSTATADDKEAVAQPTSASSHSHHSHDAGNNSTSSHHSHSGSGSCFPALGFKMPSSPPKSTDGWWCDPKDEHAFMGFSYSVSGCPSAAKMTTAFKRMRSEFKSRYVRPYGGCDKSGFTNDMVNAAWEAGVGVYPLVWFGFDGGDQWKKRKNDIVQTIKSNPKAPYVVRGVVLGSEPLFDNVLPGNSMSEQLKDLTSALSPFTGSHDTAMQVTLSEMPYTFSTNAHAQSIFSSIDILQANVLPFFDAHATRGWAATPTLKWNLDYLKQHGQGKKILFTQTGWPSTKEVWPGNNAGVVASVEDEKAYFELLDKSSCGFMKDAPKGGVGWFAHIYDDSDLGGWGILDSNLKPKFHFSPRTSCD